jgi:DNA-binding CsgD family transcriptional regulator
MVKNTEAARKARRRLAIKTGRIRDLRSKGKTPEEISEIMNTSVEIVNRIIKAIEASERKMAKTKQLFEEGYSCVEIAEKLKLPESTVRAIVNK